MVYCLGPDPDKFNWSKGWYTAAMSIRTAYLPIIKLITSCNICRYNPTPKRYRNPVNYARELQDEMLTHNLTRKQLAERHGVSSDRITQWLCLLKLPEETQKKIERMGDYWDRQVMTERELRYLRRSILSPSVP